MGNILTVAVDADPVDVDQYVEGFSRRTTTATPCREDCRDVAAAAAVSGASEAVEFRCECSTSEGVVSRPLDCLVNVSVSVVSGHIKVSVGVIYESVCGVSGFQRREQKNARLTGENY